MRPSVNVPVHGRQSAQSVMEELDVVIVGAGFNGVYLLHKLRSEGYVVRLIEAQSGLGGVWQANR